MAKSLIQSSSLYLGPSQQYGRFPSGNPARGYGPLTETLELEEPELKEHASPDHSPTRREDLQQKLAEKEAEVQQSLEQHESEKNELQTRITDLEGQIAVLQGQIAHLEDAKDRLMTAKEQELQDERRQLLKRITTQQEDHKQKIAEKEAEVHHLQQSLEQQKGQLLELQPALPPPEHGMYAESLVCMCSSLNHEL